MKVLNIVTSAYRGTIEEQDDTILWLSQSLRKAGASCDVLLHGDAVNYALADQDCSGLSFGEWRQTQPVRIPLDIARLVEDGAKVFALHEHVAERGLVEAPMVAGVISLARSDLASVMGGYDQVWRW